MSFPSSIKRLALAGLLCGATAMTGCSDIYFDRRESIAPWSGNAVEANKVVQMVDPWPPYSANRNIAFNGEVMQRAQQRYRDGYVIPPVNATTSQAYANARQVQTNAVNLAQKAATSAPNAPPPTWAGPQNSQALPQP